MPGTAASALSLTLVALVATGPAAGQATSTHARFPADAESQQRGILSYELTRTGKTVLVKAERADRLGYFQETIEFDTPSGIEVSFAADGRPLQLDWNPMTGVLQLRDPKSGEVSSFRPTPQPNLAFSSLDPTGLWARHKEEAAEAFFILHQTITSLGLRGSTRGPLSPPDVGATTPWRPTAPLEDTLTGALAPGCSASCLDTAASAFSGFWSNTSLALCCELATNYLNSRCSNQYCIGCCRLLTCDFACVFGEGYACICSRRGFSCGPPLEINCGDNWPPECV